MNRCLLLLSAFLTLPVAAEAQSAAQMIERALAAAPARARDDATVIRWNADHTYETLREGTNRLVCYDRSADEGRPAFAVQCTSIANLERVAQNRRFAATGGDREGVAALVAEAEANGTRVQAEYGSVWISMNGQDAPSARTHMTIAMSFATAESAGFPDNSRQGGAWIMAAGTSEAHLMIPGS